MMEFAIWVIAIALVIIALPTILTLLLYLAWGLVVFALWVVDEVTP